MALQFAAVVMLGKEVAAGELPFPMLALRFAGQSVLLFIVLLLLRKPLVPAPGERLPLILAATIGYGTEAALFFSALNHGKAGAVTLLFYLYPVWVMLATIALDRRPPGWRLFVALLLALAGSAVVIVGGGEVEVAPLGILLALATSLVYTAYLITADRTIRRTDPVTAAAWLGAGAATRTSSSRSRSTSTISPTRRRGHTWWAWPCSRQARSPRCSAGFSSSAPSGTRSSA